MNTTISFYEDCLEVHDGVETYSNRERINLDWIHNLVLSRSVKCIDTDSLKDCKVLKIVQPEDGYLKIKKDAFGENLESLVIKAGSLELDSRLFTKCLHLKQVVIEALGDKLILNSHVFGDCVALKSVKITAPKASLEKSDCIGLFFGCPSLEKVDLDFNLRILSLSFFEGCRALREVVVPKSIVRINHAAFSKCDSLTHIKLPDSLETVGSNQAFLELPKECVIEFLGMFWSAQEFNSLVVEHNGEEIREVEFAFDGIMNPTATKDSIVRKYKTLGDCISVCYPEECTVAKGINYDETPEETNLF